MSRNGTYCALKLWNHIISLLYGDSKILQCLSIDLVTPWSCGHEYNPKVLNWAGIRIVSWPLDHCCLNGWIWLWGLEWSRCKALTQGWSSLNGCTCLVRILSFHLMPVRFHCTMTMSVWYHLEIPTHTMMDPLPPYLLHSLMHRSVILSFRRLHTCSQASILSMIWFMHG